jgi:hypothetical protein
MITLAISKTLKGTPAERAMVLMRPFIGKDYAKQWLDEGIPIVFCLVKNDGKRTSIPAEKCAWILRNDGFGPSAVLLGKSKNYWTGCISVFTRAGDVITDADSILKFLEKAVTAKAKNDDLHSYRLEVPDDTAVYKKLWSQGGSVVLVVPVDAQLETLGQRWCKSEFSMERMQGAEILSHFKSDKNIELLKSLLKDTSIRNRSKHRSVPGKTDLELVYRKKVYSVRKTAFDALRKLGVMVDRPILEELLEGQDDQQGERIKPSLLSFRGAGEDFREKIGVLSGQ